MGLLPYQPYNAVQAGRKRSILQTCVVLEGCTCSCAMLFDACNSWNRRRSFGVVSSCIEQPGMRGSGYIRRKNAAGTRLVPFD